YSRAYISCWQLLYRRLLDQTSLLLLWFIVRRSRHILAAFVFLKCAREQTLQTGEIGPTRVAPIPQRIRARSSPPFLLQRLWVGKIFRRFLVQQRNQLLRCGRSLDLPVAINIFGAEFLT